MIHYTTSKLDTAPFEVVLVIYDILSVGSELIFRSLVAV
jgi:hypothetical protein